MPQIENPLFCQQFVLPKIVMSQYNSLTGTMSETPEEMIVDLPNKDPFGFNQLVETIQFENEGTPPCVINSPEITCSPHPCVFDNCPRKPSEDRLSPCRSSPVNRTPSPDARTSPGFRRRSLSPYRNNGSPGSNGSRRGSATTPTGYEMYQKSLLEVPVIMDYGDASSDDLSSEWDSDVPDVPPVHKVNISMI